MHALPHLAEQYHITGNEGWLQCRNDEEKRDLIKRSNLIVCSDIYGIIPYRPPHYGMCFAQAMFAIY